MNKVSLLTFSNQAFNYSKKKLIKSAKAIGINNIYSYSDKDFAQTDFYNENRKITLQNRGAGYWLWKPYYIYHTLTQLNEGEILIYCDSGVDLIARIDPLVKIGEKNISGIVLFENYQGSLYYSRTEGIPATNYTLYTELNKMRYWAKRDTFVLMNLEEERYYDCQMVDANIQLYRKNKNSLEFVKEWLSYCCNPQILTDEPNKSGLPDFENLIQHIHDQAIISLLAEKYKIELYRSPTQFGNHYKHKEFRMDKEFLVLPYSNIPKENSFYGTLGYHHRTKFNPFISRLKDYLSVEWKIFKAHF